ncbi:sugar porter family MFS transporter [Photobacterium sp. ZSDE20]|uniref:Sugar porter family MFS transporter n=1 Tax=Photobacterium pectinilyticum TaxID=2906793 RepID=A0ABT1N7V8_9GAMM|nr:sugar porter family MFS transporter [Photobacterium sp. ZSDE20]MCQ1060811.1 sugar porter family MFS transporter [Photobacterium sp. ZSDE20]MDD1828565.1 sugar porter family MFS transporter [Photobacterium sp. ZSDE20]
MEKLSAPQYGFLVALICSVGGLLFGYDIAVISGAVQYFSAYFDLSPAMVGWGVSSALIGCMAGAGVASTLSEKYGRKKVLHLSAILFAVSAIGSSMPDTFSELVIYRVIGGFGMGLSSMIVPVYLSEISPSDKRGFYGSFNQVMITFGILCTYFINYVIVSGRGLDWLVETAWRWMFFGELIPAAVLAIAAFFLPESPRWLVQQKRSTEAKAILAKANGNEKAPTILNEIEVDISRTTISNKGIYESGLGKVLWMAIAVACLSQATGINVIIYYTTVLLNSIGTGDGGTTLWGDVFFQNVLIGVVCFSAAIVAAKNADKLGRRPMMIWGSLIVAATIILVGLAVLTGNTGIWLLAVIMTYLFAFGSTCGPLPWVIAAEICPNSHRNRIVSKSTLLFWFTNVIVAQTFPMMNDSPWLQEHFNGSFPFFIYGLFSLMLAYICYRYLPETKGKTVEEIYQEFLPETAQPVSNEVAP